LPGEDSNGLTIEMASLHSPPEVNSPNNPEISNALLSFKVSGSCDINIVGNAARGKVVFYDATNEDDGRVVLYSGCSVEECFPSDDPNYGEWIAVGKPECWCWPYQCDGDADGIVEGKETFRVGSYDLGVLKTAWHKIAGELTGNDACADFDHVAEGKENFRIGSYDLGVLKENWHKLDGDLPGDCP
jgi:hypothetical protein